MDAGQPHGGGREHGEQCVQQTNGGGVPRFVGIGERTLDRRRGGIEGLSSLYADDLRRVWSSGVRLVFQKLRHVNLL
jgi:hypothetical protein